MLSTYKVEVTATIFLTCTYTIEADEASSEDEAKTVAIEDVQNFLTCHAVGSETDDYYIDEIEASIMD